MVLDQVAFDAPITSLENPKWIFKMIDRCSHLNDRVEGSKGAFVQNLFIDKGKKKTTSNAISSPSASRLPHLYSLRIEI